MQIDKAIQDNDQREYVRDFSRHEDESPLQQRCQIINAESLQDALRLQDNSNSFPAIALLSRPGLNPSNTPDISYVDQADCTYDGVRTAQAELRITVRQYLSWPTYTLRLCKHCLTRPVIIRDRLRSLFLMGCGSVGVISPPVEKEGRAIARTLAVEWFVVFS